jgi:fluoride exporter
MGGGFVDQTTWKRLLAVGAGGILGCWSRYILSSLLNPSTPNLPLGTLSANLIAGFSFGCLLGLFRNFETVSSEMRLFLTTGVIGGLSTFSAFSGEAAGLLLSAHYGWFVLHVASHVIGTLLLTLTGIALTHRVFRRRGATLEGEPQ